MPRRAALLLALLTPAACFSSSNSPPKPDAGSMVPGDDASFDAAPEGAPFEAGKPDAPPDATAEASAPDATVNDASVPDAPAADVAPDAYDAGSTQSACALLDGGVAASCAAGGPGLSNCGAGGADCCCTTLLVPGGAYSRTYTSDVDGGPTGEADPATVSGFQLDKYDVTVGRFRQFVSAVLPADGGAGWLPLAGSGKHTHLNGGLGLVDVGAPADAGTVYETGWLAADDVNIAPTDANLTCGGGIDATWTPAPGNQETLPIDCVNWYEAYAFCIWDGGFLPSETEWEYAAAGGSRQREYPWGSTDPGTANQYAIYSCLYNPSDAGLCPAGADIAPVGMASLGAGLWGQLDLAGNLYQWTLDWNAAYVTPCADCARVTPASFKVLRGGYFAFDATGLYPPLRHAYPPTDRANYHGFRCARTPG